MHPHQKILSVIDLNQRTEVSLLQSLEPTRVSSIVNLVKGTAECGVDAADSLESAAMTPDGSSSYVKWPL
jgi:hypothetical protein